MDRKPWASVLAAEDRPPTLVALADQPEPVSIPTILRRESRWAGPLPETFRVVPNKPAIDFAGTPLYPEFVLLRLLERAGWSGVWVKNWRGRAFWTDINSSLLLPPAQAELFTDIERRTGNTRGGCWDIFAWRGEEPLFIESKQHRNDRLSPAQAVWLEKALELGLGASSFLIAEYTVPKRSQSASEHFGQAPRE